MHLPRTRLIYVGGCCLSLALALAACGGGSGNDGERIAAERVASQIAAATNPSSSAQGAFPATSDSGATSTCGGAVSAVKAALTTFPEVTNVEADDCEELYISTSIPESDAFTPNSKKAVAICQAATKVAYIDGINSLYVRFADNKEATDATSEAKDVGCVPE